MRFSNSQLYIYDLDDWPQFRWDSNVIEGQLASVRHRQGRLLGVAETLGFGSRQQATVSVLTLDVTKSSEIEGEIFVAGHVKSSIARRLGVDVAGMPTPARDVEDAVEMMLDATQNFDQPLTADRLKAWHTCLFPLGRSGMTAIDVGVWRKDLNGQMQVVSGPIGREMVHFEAPAAERIEVEMDRFLDWFETADLDYVLKAAVSHLWFETIHPFDDGNGRIGRAIMDMALARADGSKDRFYSMSAQIHRQRAAYYKALEVASRASLDITNWITWFLRCLDESIRAAEGVMDLVQAKTRFWTAHSEEAVNVRQRLILNRLLDGFVGHLTSSKWAVIAKCSPDTALRDIADLVEKGILVRAEGGGRSTHYTLTSSA